MSYVLCKCKHAIAIAMFYLDEHKQMMLQLYGENVVDYSMLCVTSLEGDWLVVLLTAGGDPPPLVFKTTTVPVVAAAAAADCKMAVLSPIWRLRNASSACSAIWTPFLGLWLLPLVATTGGNLHITQQGFYFRATCVAFYRYWGLVLENENPA